MKTMILSKPATSPDVVLYVPGKPVSANRMYGSAGNGKRYLTHDARAWETLVAYISHSKCRELCNDIKIGALALPLHIRCTFYHTRCDADNLLKTTLDGLKIGLGIDDRAFAHVEAVKATGTYKDGVHIAIWAARVPEIEQALEHGLQKVKELAR